MDESKREMLEKVEKELRQFQIVQRLGRIYQIDMSVIEDRHTDARLWIRIALKDRSGDLVDTIEIQTTSAGLVYPEEAIQKIVLAFEAGQDNSLWKAGTKRIRRMARAPGQSSEV